MALFQLSGLAQLSLISAGVFQAFWGALGPRGFPRGSRGGSLEPLGQPVQLNFDVIGLQATQVLSVRARSAVFDAEKLSCFRCAQGQVLRCGKGHVLSVSQMPSVLAR